MSDVVLSGFYVGDVGSSIVITINGLPTNFDIATAQLTQLLVTKPGGVQVIWPTSGSLVPTSPNKVTYTTVDGDLDVDGIYILQPYIVINDASKHRADKIKLLVSP